MRIQGNVACVTGAASGLGRATAEALAKAGAQVAVLDRDADGARAAAAAIGGIGIACDIASEASVEAAFDEVAAKFGTPRILVGCAGIAPGKRIVGRQGVMPLDDFRRVIDVNLIGTFNVLRIFADRAAKLEPLDEGERGVAINTASIAAYEGQAGQTAYSASKAGVAGLTLPAARDLASLGIRVCTIAPGIFETPLLKGLSDAAQKGLEDVAQFPKRLGRAEEFAALALHIVGNLMLNGETIRLDGGVRLPPR